MINTAHSRETWIVVAAEKKPHAYSVSTKPQLSKEVDAMREKFEAINATLKAKSRKKTLKKD